MLETVTTTTIIYDDPHIRVIWHPGHTDYVLITFADLLITADGHRFFADKPVAKLGIACVGIVATGGNFFPKHAVQAALPAILARISGYSQRVVYGGSMGGYAAVKHSALLGATEVVALCPPWSIDPAECEGNFPGWPELMHPALEGMGTRPWEISGEVYVFADMFDQVDKFQAGMILRADPTATIINVPMVKHHVVPVFAGTEILRRLIDACRGRRKAELHAISRELRKNSERRLNGLIETAIEKHPGMTYRVMATRRTHDIHIGALGAKNLFPAVGYLLGRGDPDAAVRYLEWFQHELREPHDIVLAGAMQAQLLGRQAHVLTHHGTSLVYDFARRFCVHVRDITPHLHAPVRFELRDSAAALFAEVGGVRIDLHIDDKFKLTDRLHGAPRATRFTLVSPRGNRFTMACNGLFVSAEPEGDVFCNREAAYEWEQFKVG
jgi:hypothetical protein